MQNVIGWIGTAASLIGSFLVAFGFMLIAYCFFLTGAFIWAGIAWRTGQRSLLILNLGFTLANLIGVWRIL